MNYHIILAAILPPAVAAAAQLPAPWSSVVGGLLTALAALAVRPSQVSVATGDLAAKMPGKPPYREPGS